MQTIDLDICKPDVAVIVFAKQGDVGRKFRVRIFDGATPYNIPEKALISMWYSGTSGMGNYTSIGDRSAFAVTDNIVTVEFITQMLVNKGGGSLCLVLHSPEGGQLGMWNIPYVVEAVPGIDSAPAKEHFTALSDTVQDLNELSQKMQEAAAAYTVDDTLAVFAQPADAAVSGDYMCRKEDRLDMLTVFDEEAMWAGTYVPGKGIPWGKTDALPSVSGHYYLTADVNQPPMVTMNDGDRITLDLNGHTVTCASYARAYKMPEVHAELVILDSVGNGKMIPGNAQQGGILYASGKNCLIKIHGGIFDGSNYPTTNGTGAVAFIMDNAVLEIYGGIFVGSEISTDNGGVVSCYQQAVIRMYGGEIYGGHSKFGGNISLINSAIEMYGGKIHSGTASQEGGNIRSTQGKVLVASSGVISDGAAPIGSNIYSYNGSVVCKGNVSITGSSENGIYTGGNTL